MCNVQINALVCVMDLTHLRHVIQGFQKGLLLHDLDGDSLPNLECGCMHASVCLCVCLSALSLSISVSSTTVFPVLNFINIPSSPGCNLKSYD